MNCPECKSEMFEDEDCVGQMLWWCSNTKCYYREYGLTADEIKDLRHENKAAQPQKCEELHTGNKRLKKHIEKCESDCWPAELKAENKRLREFARSVIRQECWGYSELDGFEIQELAERLGLIEAHTATQDDVNEDSDYEVGDTIYKFTEILKASPERTDECSELK